jgi:hypothetical protein
MRPAKTQAQGTRRADILDAKWNDRCPGVERGRHLVKDGTRCVRRSGEDHEKQLGLDNSLDHSIIPGRAVRDVARRYPAPDTGSFNAMAYGIRKGLVVLRVADEDIVRQGAVLPPYTPPNYKRRPLDIHLPIVPSYFRTDKEHRHGRTIAPTDQ